MRSLTFAWSTAALVAVLAGACGKIPEAGDGGGDDDVIDAAPPPDGPPPSGIAQVQVLRSDNMPLVGVDVVFTRRDGTVIMGTKTDASGRAGTTITEGDLVWVQYVEGVAPNQRTMLYTIDYLHVGDDIRIGGNQSSPPSNTNISVTIPGAVAGATAYLVDNGCESQQVTDISKPVSMSMSTRCIDSQQRFAVTARAIDASEKVLAATSATNLQLPGNINVALPPFGQPKTVNFTVNNIPMEASLVRVNAQTFRTGILEEYNDSEFAVPLVPPVTTYTQALRFPAAFTQGFSHVAFASLGTQASPLGTIINAERVDGDPGAVTIDLATAFPGISAVTATLSSGKAEFVWVEKPGTDSAVSQEMHAGDVARFAIGTSTVGEDFEWQVIAPASATSPYVLEAPPAFRPTLDAIRGTPDLNKSIAVQYIEVDVIEGYKAIKATYGTGLFEDLPPGPFKLRASFSLLGK